ncbi:MAG TPA: PspC domain-containing protein [Actinomycetota bacterium]|nr:PspC domain-containing protein [Actinomycetota bacterium]
MSAQAKTATAHSTRSVARRSRGPLSRAAEGRFFYGVAAGIGDHAGIDPTLIRIAFGLLSLAGGLGIILYVGLALVLPERTIDERRPRALRGGLRPLASVTLITAGLMWLARQSGFWFGDAVVGPIAIAGVGAAVLWARSDARRPTGSVAGSNPMETLFQGRVSARRVISGGLLIVIGGATFLAANTDPYGAGFDFIRLLLLPILATCAGLLLIFGPWLYRLASQLTDEHRERIRSEERSALAAHLHDSVLQTLALIQRSDSPHRMAHLARTQERELRAWLFGKVGPLDDETLSGALEALAGRCESRYDVSVDVVVVGDVGIDEPLGALVAATGEAIANAAAHSGSSTISVYAEVESDVVTVYVRDEGSGFTVTSVPGDRRGIRDSIEGRIRRAGGTAIIQSELGAGTEVILTMPRSRR